MDPSNRCRCWAALSASSLLPRSQARAEAGHAASSAKAAAQESLEAAEAAAVAAKEAAAAAAEQLARPAVAAARQIRRQAGNARDVAERAAYAGGSKVPTIYDIMACIVELCNVQHKSMARSNLDSCALCPLIVMGSGAVETAVRLRQAGEASLHQHEASSGQHGAEGSAGVPVSDLCSARMRMVCCVHDFCCVRPAGSDVKPLLGRQSRRWSTRSTACSKGFTRRPLRCAAAITCSLHVMRQVRSRCVVSLCKQAFAAG